MGQNGFDAFLSYSHEDNERGGGRVLALAGALRDEFAVTTGEELDLFVDREAIEWGQLWRRVIVEAVGGVPFFIPIVTPKYIRSVECRRELIQFFGQAESQGLSKLLLPILFIDTPGITEDSDDEVCAIIARTQFIDWRSIRLLNPGDSKVAQAVNALALRLRDLKSEAREIAISVEPSNTGESLQQLRSAVKNIDDRISVWMESVEFDRSARRHWGSALEDRSSRMRRLRAQNAVRGALLSTMMQLGAELLPIAQNRLEKAKNYARLTIELDPFVNAAIRLVELLPEHASLLNNLFDGVNEAYLNIDPPEYEIYKSFGVPESLVRQNQRVAAAEAAIAASAQFAKEGNEIVLSWRQKLMALQINAVVPLIGD